MLKRLAALAGAVGTIVVGSMATDTWQATRSGVARLLGRGEPARRVVIGAQRDEVNAALVAMASARNGRRAQAPVLRGLGRSVPARRVCIGLLLLALVPRMVGLTADLPYMHHPDEPVNLRVIDAMVPLANMFGYVNTLRSMSQGRAQYTMHFDHYEQVPQAVADEVRAKMA